MSPLNLFAVLLSLPFFQHVCHARSKLVNVRSLTNSPKIPALDVDSKSTCGTPLAFLSAGTSSRGTLFKTAYPNRSKNVNSFENVALGQGAAPSSNLALYLKSPKIDGELHYDLSGGSRRLVRLSAVSDASPVVKTNASVSSASSSVPITLEQVKNAVKNVSLLGLWYTGTVLYNVDNKRALNVCHLPLTVAALQMAVGVPIYLLRWLFGLKPFPKIYVSTEGVDLHWDPKDSLFTKIIRPVKNALVMTKNTIKAYRSILTQSAYYASLHALSVTALGAGAVGFVHLMKATEPIFASIASLVFGDAGSGMSFPTFLSLLPIVGGVAWSSFKDLNFSETALAASLASNVFASIKRVEAKKFFKQDLTKIGENLTPSNMFSLVSIFSTLMLAPLALIEKDKWVQAYQSLLQSHGKDGLIKFASLVGTSGLAYALYNEMSFLALSQLSPVSHAVANTVKRVFLILTSVAVFKTKLSRDSIYGSTLAIAGTLLYSLSKHFLG